MAENTSIIVSDDTRELYAIGYLHDAETIELSDLINSATAVNEEQAKDFTSPGLTPLEFLAEWHKLALQNWDNPDSVTMEAFETLDHLADNDAYHYEVEMDNGVIRSIQAYRFGRGWFNLTF